MNAKEQGATCRHALHNFKQDIIRRHVRLIHALAPPPLPCGHPIQCGHPIRCGHPMPCGHCAGCGHRVGGHPMRPAHPKRCGHVPCGHPMCCGHPALRPPHWLRPPHGLRPRHGLRSPLWLRPPNWLRPPHATRPSHWLRSHHAMRPRHAVWPPHAVRPLPVCPAHPKRCGHMSSGQPMPCGYPSLRPPPQTQPRCGGCLALTSSTELASRAPSPRGAPGLHAPSAVATSGVWRWRTRRRFVPGPTTTREDEPPRGCKDGRMALFAHGGARCATHIANVSPLLPCIYPTTDGPNLVRNRPN